MVSTTVFVCALCGFSPQQRTREGVSGGEHLATQLKAELTDRGLQDVVTLEPLRCMAGCSRPCNVSVAAPDKLTYIFSGVSAQNGAETMAEFCQQHVNSTDGRVPYRERSAEIRTATAFVLPPLPQSPNNCDAPCTESSALPARKTI